MNPFRDKSLTKSIGQPGKRIKKNREYRQCSVKFCLFRPTKFETNSEPKTETTPRFPGLPTFWYSLFLISWSLKNSLFLTIVSCRVSSGRVSQYRILEKTNCPCFLVLNKATRKWRQRNEFSVLFCFI